jgi:hypothetical protein
VVLKLVFMDILNDDCLIRQQKLADKLQASGFRPEWPHKAATALGEVFQDQLATKSDVVEFQGRYRALVLRDRIELSTSPLPMECSTTELPQQYFYRFRYISLDACLTLPMISKKTMIMAAI